MSKQFIAILLLVLLTSACNQPVNLTTLPTLTPIANSINPTPSITPTPLIVTATQQGQNTSALPTVILNTPTATLALAAMPLDTPTLAPIATVSASCPAPIPHVKVDQQVSVTVEDWDKLKLRSRAALTPDTILMELPQYTQLRILDGPVCVLSPETDSAYLFWKVAVIPSGEIGWVAEGDIWHYFIY